MRYIADHDLHIHTQLSLCSGDPEQNKDTILNYGIENGMTTLCLTDHMWDSRVPGASGCQQNVMFRAVIRRMEKTPAVTGKHQFHTTFAGTVRVIAPHGVGFPVTGFLFPVFVTLVRTDGNDATHTGAVPAFFQNVGGTDDIGFKGIQRFPVGFPDQRLRRQMKNDLRLERLHDPGQFPAVPDVTDLGPDLRLDQRKMVRFGIRGEGYPADFRTQFFQPDCQP